MQPSASVETPARSELDGRRRVIVESVRPEVDGGRFPIKRVVDDVVKIEADCFVDGHDKLSVILLHRHEGLDDWHVVPMVAKGNDLFVASFVATAIGRHFYTVEAWVDAFETFRSGLSKKVLAGQDVRVELLEGGALIAAAASRAAGDDAKVLTLLARTLSEELGPPQERVQQLLAEDIAAIVLRHPDRSKSTRYRHELAITVDERRARFSAWYEFFPRSRFAEGVDASSEPGKHGTLKDAEKMLGYVAELGFDVVYLPPIHPIGTAHRKGRNNTLTTNPGDPGSPWAIGAKEGGHKAIHPELGTIEDFERFVTKARDLGIETAIDVAFQASPDHPYVKDHPEWFVKRADGTIQYAENPPKKYQDVYPFAFDGEAWRPLWEELLSVFTFWLERGVHIFRVDNPHTKPLPFWEWCMAEVKRRDPRAIFLAEAFTRPKLMYGLAKRGFTQSYTYFAWRSTKHDLATYLQEIACSPVTEFFRPNFWPNTPDILTEELQHGGRPAFMRRAVLAATMSSNWGMYGPAYELMEHVPRPGAEEYIDNEKFERKTWDLARPDSLRHLIARLNRIRRDNPALQANKNVRVHETDDEMVFAFSKATDDGTNVVLVVVNLDGHHPHGCHVTLDLAALGVTADESFQVHDVIGDGRWHWRGPKAYVHLDPTVMPAQIFVLRRLVRNETSFEYFL